MELRSCMIARVFDIMQVKLHHDLVCMFLAVQLEYIVVFEKKGQCNGLSITGVLL